MRKFKRASTAHVQVRGALCTKHSYLQSPQYLLYTLVTDELGRVSFERSNLAVFQKKFEDKNE